MRKAKPAKLSWYTARCHFRSEITGKRKYGTQLWEESFFLVHATSKKHAERRAKQLAQREQVKYKNFAGEIVSWKFATLIDVRELIASRLGDGTEVYSRFFSRRATPRASVRNK
jgi:Domain of unknown function (DUF4288)